MILRLAALKTFFKLSRQEKWLFFEACCRLLRARVILRLFPFKRIAPGLGFHMRESPPEGHPAHKLLLGQMREALERALRYTPWDNSCLVQAVAVKKMLDRRRIPCTLYLGVAKDAKNGQDLKAHAWTRSGRFFLTGKKKVDLASFTVVSMFT